MKKISLALIISSLLISSVFADEAIQEVKLSNIEAVQKILESDPENGEANFRMAAYYGSAEHLDSIKHLEYLRKAADSNFPDAELQYGFLLINNNEPKQGLKYIQKSAERGYVKALTLLGDLYFAGYYNQSGGVVIQANADLSEQYLIQAVTQNDPDARYTLAYLYLNPNLGKQDIQQALKLLEENINYDTKNIHLPSVVTLIDIYSQGQYLSADPAKLVDYFYLASLQGYVPALYPVGMMQKEGAKGVRLEIIKNDSEAFANLLKAAKAGYIDAMFSVGEMYFKGEGVKQSDTDAYIWMAIAEELSNSEKKYSEIILELIPRKDQDAAIAKKDLQLSVYKK
ncbi:tetratricopeptide repeat protein [Wohlfahrtiimonas larvae]|uniref:Sel1 repeat family protein n=1 Tax=Wohlfahrtiimonas larvae TaxID=1157986 RepID=A0ABP9MG38_9GAMM|nr:tetratricopeptide repeat protein [Wohlfahrtiimonas larvae]